MIKLKKLISILIKKAFNEMSKEFVVKNKLSFTYKSKEL